MEKNSNCMVIHDMWLPFGNVCRKNSPIYFHTWIRDLVWRLAGLFKNVQRIRFCEEATDLFYSPSTWNQTCLSALSSVTPPTSNMSPTPRSRRPSQAICDAEADKFGWSLIRSHTHVQGFFTTLAPLSISITGQVCVCVFTFSPRQWISSASTSQCMHRLQR